MARREPLAVPTCNPCFGKANRYIGGIHLGYLITVG